MADTGASVGVVCGNCGGNVFMATCHHFRGTGHEWTLVSICMVCRAVHWTEGGCLDCKKDDHRTTIVPLYDADLNPINREADRG